MALSRVTYLDAVLPCGSISRWTAVSSVSSPVDTHGQCWVYGADIGSECAERSSSELLKVLNDQRVRRLRENAESLSFSFGKITDMRAAQPLRTPGSRRRLPIDAKLLQTKENRGAKLQGKHAKSTFKILTPTCQTHSPWATLFRMTTTSRRQSFPNTEKFRARW